MVKADSTRRSEMRAASELPISERPTLSSVPSAIPVPLPEETEHKLPKLKPNHEPTAAPLDARIERLLTENRMLLNERKQLREIADIRAERSNQCLAEARKAKKLARAYRDACLEAEKLAADPFEQCQAGVLALEQARVRANEAFAALVTWADETL